MKHVMLLLLGASVALAAPHAGAQQIVAQSNFVNRQQSAIPQISVTVRADFVLFSLRYSTATRSADGRKDELTKMFQTVTQRAGKAEGVTIEVGQPGNSGALETAAMKELIVQRGDQSSIDLVLKVNVRPGDTFAAIRARTEKFVADTPLSRSTRYSIKQRLPGSDKASSPTRSTSFRAFLVPSASSST